MLQLLARRVITASSLLPTTSMVTPGPIPNWFHLIIHHQHFNIIQFHVNLMCFSRGCTVPLWVFSTPSGKRKYWRKLSMNTKYGLNACWKGVLYEHERWGVWSMRSVVERTCNTARGKAERDQLCTPWPVLYDLYSIRRSPWSTRECGCS